MISRRGLLAGILGAAAAPAFVRAGSLMVLRPLRASEIELPAWFQVVAPDDRLLQLVDYFELERDRLCGVPKLYRGEIGEIDAGFRFITSPILKARL
jgi:hypothetical protein